jgi:uncharacterized protein (DUF1697 family)
MPPQIVLLRGVKLGPRNRVAMPELREALTDAGFANVRTYLQSGNVVLESRASPAPVARKCERVIEDRFGLDIDVVVRSRARRAALRPAVGRHRNRAKLGDRDEAARDGGRVNERLDG